MLNFNQYEVLSFDCYGTLIDWESGILAALKPVLLAHDITLEDNQILELFAEIENALEVGEYITYREVMRRTVQRLGDRLGFKPASTEVDSLTESIKNWQPFPDTVEALKALKQKYKLAVISNTDDDIFVFTAKHLEVEFDWVITAEQAKSYKPSFHNFELAKSIMNLPDEKILHVAQSIYHDIVPANSLGLTSVWVNRRGNKAGAGATMSASGKPDLEVPDLKTLVKMMNPSS